MIKVPDGYHWQRGIIPSSAVSYLYKERGCVMLFVDFPEEGYVMARFDERYTRDYGEQWFKYPNIEDAIIGMLARKRLGLKTSRS